MPWSGTVTRLPSTPTVEPAGRAASSSRTAPSAGTSSGSSTVVVVPAEPWAGISSSSTSSGVSSTGSERVSWTLPMVRAIGVLGPSTPYSGVNTSSSPSSVQVPSPATAMLSESSPSSIEDRCAASSCSGTARRAEVRSTSPSASSSTRAPSGMRVTEPGIIPRVSVWAGNSKGPSSPSAAAGTVREPVSATTASSGTARARTRALRACEGRDGGSSTDPA